MVHSKATSVDMTENSEADSAKLATWLQARVVDTPEPRRLRLAWMGRTSDDEVQDPTISLPRQLRSCHVALGDDMEIRLHFWDVETSRKALGARGSSSAWRNFDIDIPRDGGIADLLAEAQRPDRRFDGVICESIDRIARLTYQSTKIEHDLEQLGIPLIAADEPVMRSARTGRIEKKAGMVLLRRAKQGVAEWYVLEMLEKSRNGIEIHTDQGFNVGKPPYGYRAERIRHPVPAKRAEGKHKTKLTPDTVRGPVVTRIFEMRANDGLSYRMIASRLNEDLTENPPPEPVDPTRALGRWSPPSVREILLNPKYTGHMVWNRRATKDKQSPGKLNPRDEWVISSRPVHEALVDVELFLAAQPTPRRRDRARADLGAMALNPHRQTKSVYRLRSYVYCSPCGTRMHGKRNHAGTPYSYCQPRGRVRPDGHPATVWVNERKLTDVVSHFFNTHVLGPDRVQLVAASLPAAATHAAAAHRQAEIVLERRVAELERSADNLLRALERNADADGHFFARMNRRVKELDREMAEAANALAAHRAAAPEPPTNDVSLLDLLPLVEIDLNELAADRLRRFLDAFRVEIHYDHRSRRATLKAEISGQLIEELTRVANWGQPTPERGNGEDSHAGDTAAHSLRKCPRQDSNLRPRLRRAVLYPLSYGGSATEKEYQGSDRRRSVAPGRCLIRGPSCGGSCLFSGCAGCRPPRSMCRPGKYGGWGIMRWRPALALTAVAVVAALLGGVGPAWADQLAPGAGEPAPAARHNPIMAAAPMRPAEVTAESDSAPTASPPKPELAPAPAGPATIRDAIVNVAVNGAVAGANRSAGRQAALRSDVLPPTVLPTATAVVPSGGSGTGGGDGDTDPQATGMAVGSVLLIGVGLIAAGVALVGLRNRRETADHGH
ncbi:hypothetical protein Afe04nite_27210 [Asanoa ferruginea]|nr:hypothetical protein Afe04nite_27210 [Asanoa ferruginea]